MFPCMSILKPVTLSIYRFQKFQLKNGKARGPFFFFFFFYSRSNFIDKIYMEVV